MRDRVSWLTAAMLELADTFAAGFDEARYGRGFAGMLAELLGPAEVGLLIPASATHPAVATGSSERAADLARLEAAGTSGPCTDSYLTGRVVRQESLAAAQTRWTEFAASARAAGLSITSALPIRHHDETIGAVSVLSARDQLVRAADVGMARTLIEAAAIGILQQRALQLSLQTTQQLQHALDSRVVIEQAKGALAARLDCTPDDAFHLLRGYARANNRRLTEVAGAVVQGDLPAHDLAVTSRTARH